MDIWNKTTMDEKGKIVIPKELRQYLKMVKGDKILWIGVKKKNKEDDKKYYLLDIGVDRKGNRKVE